MDFRGMPVDDEDDSGDGMYIDRGAVEEYTQSYEDADFQGLPVEVDDWSADTDRGDVEEDMQSYDVDFRSSTGSESKCEGAFYPIMLYVFIMLFHLFNFS